MFKKYLLSLLLKFLLLIVFLESKIFTEVSLTFSLYYLERKQREEQNSCWGWGCFKGSDIWHKSNLSFYAEHGIKYLYTLSTSVVWDESQVIFLVFTHLFMVVFCSVSSMHLWDHQSLGSGSLESWESADCSSLDMKLCRSTLTQQHKPNKLPSITAGPLW